MLPTEIVEKQDRDSQGGQAESEARAGGVEDHHGVAVGDAEGEHAKDHGREGEHQDVAGVDMVSDQTADQASDDAHQGLETQHAAGHGRGHAALGQMSRGEAGHSDAAEEVAEVGGQKHVELRRLQSLLQGPASRGSMNAGEGGCGDLGVGL